MVPGVTLPGADLLLFVITLLVTSVFHELGHALAAVREGVPVWPITTHPPIHPFMLQVEAFGGFALVVYVGAFVELHTGRLSATSAVARLRIFCAGVWHNVALAAAAFLAITFLSGLICIRSMEAHVAAALLSPLYMSGGGVLVLAVAPWSVLHTSIHPGDVIHAVGTCM